MEMRDPEDFEFDNVDKNDNDEAIAADWTGRELLLSSIEEKCFHQVIKEIIETNKKDQSDLEKKFVEIVVKRLAVCEREFN